MTGETPGPEPATEIAALHAQLAEAEDILRAIRDGEVDALVVNGGLGDEVHLLGGGERIYRQFIEALGGGTAVVSVEGDIQGCDAGLAAALRRPLEQVVGTAMRDHISPEDHAALRAVLAQPDVKSGVLKVRLLTSEGQLVPVYLSATHLLSVNAEPVSCLVFTDLKKVISAEQALNESESQLKRAMADVPFPMMIHAEDGEVRAVNQAWTDFSGYSLEDIPTIADWTEKAYGERAGLVREDLDKLYAAEGRTVSGEYTIRTASGEEHIWDFCSAPLGTLPDGRRLVTSTARDVTQRKQSEVYRNVAPVVLRILNESTNLHDCVGDVIAALKAQTGIDAVGLRLQDGEDFPYFAQEGLPEDLLVTEKSLIELDANGDELRDADGNVSLEGVCGLVLSAKTDASDSILTPGGSFWTNDSLPLLDLPADRDPRLHPRNACMLQGCASIALVPIRNKGGVIGLIHLNDRRKNRFSLQTIELLEGIASQIGAALMRLQAEQSLRDAFASIVDVIGNVSEVRDPYTAGHQRRVAELASAIARELGMSEADSEDIRVAGLMHDIGKMSVPAEILSKPRILSPMELMIVRGHAEAGYGIISSAHMRDPIADLVYQHHERCDGSGYPRGLGADELLAGSKVLMVADVVEAMMSHRPYRAALGQEAAFAEVEQGAGRLYDSGVVEACLRIFREDGFAFSEA